FQPGPFVESADLILVLDQDVPYIPTQVTPRPGTTVVQIDVDPVKERIPLWSFPVSIPIRADTSRALDLIADYATDLISDSTRARIDARRAELTVRHQQRIDAREAAALKARGARPIANEWLGY